MGYFETDFEKHTSEPNLKAPRGAFESASLALSAAGLAVTYASKSQDFYNHFFSLSFFLRV